LLNGTSAQKKGYLVPL